MVREEFGPQERQIQVGINRVAAGGWEPQVFCDLEENLLFLCGFFAFYVTSSFQVSASDFFTHPL